MPRIPGVNDAPPKPPEFQAKPLIATILAVILCASGFALWLSHRRQTNVGAAAPAEVAPEPAVSSPAPVQQKPANADSDMIGTVEELAKPWSSKAFHVLDPETHASIPAMVIHIPGAGNRPSYWAFSTNTPFSQCALEYVTDVAVLSQRYAYPATHPMLVSDCDGTLYDPLKMATLPDGSWVRGDIVRGGGIRPPIAIEVQVRGRYLVAGRIE